VGVNLFIASGLSGAPLNDVSKHAIPLAAVQVLALAVITFVPAISLWLPGLIR
jgi:C4-dicarboxylate transporter DctM subunit